MQKPFFHGGAAATFGLLLACGFARAQDPEVPINPNLPAEVVGEQSTRRYIVQFDAEPVARLNSRPTRDKAQRQVQIRDQQEQFAQDLLTLRGVTARPKGPAAPTLFDFQYDMALNGVAVALTDDEAAQVASLPYVTDIEADRPVHAILAQSVPQINADDVATLYGGNGTGILVSVIDTGVDYNHPALGGGIGPSFKVVGGYDFVNNDSNPMDDHYHGTHCAGIVAADGAVKGVAPNANILAVKVLSASGSGWNTQVIAGINYSLNPDGNVGTNDGAHVISMSLGSLYGTPIDATATATNNASAAGVVCVAGAGNEGPGYDTILSPGTAVSAITVGAVSKTDVIASFSSRGSVDGYWVSNPNTSWRPASTIPATSAPVRQGRTAVRHLPWQPRTSPPPPSSGSFIPPGPSRTSVQRSSAPPSTLASIYPPRAPAASTCSRAPRRRSSSPRPPSILGSSAPSPIRATTR